MRLKTVLVVLMTLMFLTTSLFTVAFSKSVLTKETRLAPEKKIPQITQTNPKDSIFDQKETSDTSNFSSSKTEENLAEFRTPNIFPFDSFIRGINTYNTDRWRDFANVDEGSAELVIGINNAQPDSYVKISDLIVENGGKLVRTVSAKGEVIAVVADLPLDLVPSFAEDGQASGLVRYIEPNMMYQAQLVPNDFYWGLQWGPQKIEADYAWNTTIGDPSVLVAVIDTGIDYDHPDLAANYVPLGYDWVNDDNDTMDDRGHGTHVAGILAAVLNNGIGIAGVAQVSIMAEKVLDSSGVGFWDWIANGIIHATDQSVKIISMSLGGYTPSELVYDAVRYAYDNGVLVVAAAGNDATSQKPYPAAYDEVVAVTATDQYDNPAWFTNFGEWVEVAAPGVDIYSTVWDNIYTYMSGTSMSTPHVSGTAALIWSQFPNMTRDWVRAQLRYTADDLGDPGFDNYYGYGRVNARKAVEQVPPDHDLLVMNWELPQFVEPGGTAAIDTTVLNFGTNDESNITVQLLVNGSIVDSSFISFLLSGASITVNSSWSPMVEGIYNITSYVVPVSGETVTENNIISKMVRVRYLPGLLVIDTPGPEDTGALDNLGYEYTLVTPSQFATVNLYEYNVLFVGWIPGDTLVDALLARADEIADWVAAGNGIVALAEFGEVNRWAWLPLWVSGSLGFHADTVHILNPAHSVMSGLTDADLSGWGNSYHGYFISYDPAWEALAEGVEAAQPVTLAATYGAGRIAITDQDPDWHLYYEYEEGAEKLLRNMIEWATLYIQYEHELTVSVEAPIFLELGNLSLLNATVYNRGLSNETDVELQLLINGTVVNNVTISELVNGTSYTIDYEWTPTTEATYNVTAYAPPVAGENITMNNVATKFVAVTYPLIRPIEGQWANYTLNYYDATGRIVGTGYWNVTYDHYVEPYLIYVTVWFKDPSGFIGTEWMIVNIINRWVESGIWAGLWYPGWIETNITLGSTVNLLDGTATVVGSRIIYALEYGIYPIDCWELYIESYGIEYTFWYDKVSGLWVGMESTPPYPPYYRSELMLVATNIPVGVKYEHEIAVVLDVPSFLDPGDSSLLNATVHNIGLSNETDVELQLLINGTVVNNVTISELVNGTSYTIDYPWTPTVEATYNVTAYAPPVLDENVTANNVMSKMVYVRYVDVALISDHSELLAITGILDSMGVGYDIYNDNNIHLYTEDLSLLLNYPAVIFYTDSRRITSDEYSALDSYLSSGGNLLVTGFDSLIGDSLLADLVRSSSYGDNMGEPDLYVVDATHPIMNGPYGSFPPGYHISGLYSDNDAAEADTARMAVTIAELADGYDKIIATDGLLGKIVFWNGVGPNDWTWNADCEAMFKNTLVWFIIRYEHELSVSLDAPAFLEPGDSSLLNATVYNRGLSNETNVGLLLLINGTEVDSVVVPELLTGSSYTLSYLWTPRVEATYNVTGYAIPVPGENITVNNVATKMVRVTSLTYVLFDQTHGTDSVSLYSTWVINLTGRGYIVDTLTTSPITPPALAGYDVFAIPQAHHYYSSDELSAIQDFVLNGGGLLVIGDDDPYIYTNLTSFAGITWTYGGVSGITYDITSHEVTQGVTSVYLDAPIAEISVAAPALDLIKDPAGGIMLAVSEQVGRVIGFADEGSLWNYGILQEDNLLLANNMIDWLKRKRPMKYIENFLAKADEVLDEEMSYVDTAPISESLRAEMQAKIWEIKALKHEALEELVMRVDDMIVDARGYVDRAEFEFRYMEEPEESARLLAEAKELLALAEDEFSRGNYEPALRDALTAREKAIIALRVAGFTLKAKSSKNIWFGFTTVEEAKLNDILWKLDEFNIFIEEHVGKGDISPEVGATLMEYNNEVKSWIEKAKDRLSEPVLSVLEGDVNVDGYVGSEDFSILSGAYGTSSGEPAYVLEADFDLDGYIGSADFNILAGAYGNTV